MTFLELCQKVAAESRTVRSGLPTAVTGQTGRLAGIVRWTGDAWRSIQTAHPEWRWMQGEFQGALVAGTQRYRGASFDDEATGTTIARFGDWICRGRGEDRFSIHESAIGAGEEGPISFLEWDDFYVTKLRGTQTPSKPQFFSFTPANQLIVSPVPDTDYVIRGLYRKDVQELTANTDVPEMPARFHDVIVSAALEMLADHDEAMSQLPLWRLRKIRGFSELEIDQLPTVTFGGPLA